MTTKHTQRLIDGWCIGTRKTRLGNKLDGFRTYTFFTASPIGAPLVQTISGWERQGSISGQGGIKQARSAIAKAKGEQA